MLRDEIKDKPMFDDLDVLLFADRIQQRPLDLFTGNVFMMQDPELRVPAFFPQLKVAFGVFVKTRSPFYDLLDAFGTFPDDDLYRMRITETIPCYQCILDMFF